MFSNLIRSLLDPKDSKESTAAATDNDFRAMLCSENGQRSSILFDSYRVNPATPVQIETPHLLNEMLFGTVPLVLEGTSTKLHYLTDMGVCLISKVFKPTMYDRLRSVSGDSQAARRKLNFDSNSSPSTPVKDALPHAPRKNRALRRPERLTLAVAVLISLEHEKLVFQQFVSVERCLNQLISDILKTVSIREFRSGSLPKSSSSRSNSSSHTRRLSLQKREDLKYIFTNFLGRLKELLDTPRMQNPLWLNFSHEFEHSQFNLKIFMSNLKSLMKTQDHRFVASAITAALSFHLSWVQSLIIDSVTEHSDAVLSQLHNLQGRVACQNPDRLVHIIVIGEEAAVTTMLSVLSFFVRVPSILLSEVSQPKIDMFDGSVRISTLKSSKSELCIGKSMFASFLRALDAYEQFSLAGFVTSENSVRVPITLDFATTWVDPTTAPENSNCGLTRNVVLVNMNSRESYVVSPSADMTIEGANSILAMLQTASALHELGLSSEACCSYIDDRLRLELHSVAVLLAFLQQNPSCSKLDISRSLGVPDGDIQFRACIAGMLDPKVKLGHIATST